MGFSSFLSKLGDGISNIFHSVVGAISGGYHDAKDIVSGVGSGISHQLDNVSGQLNHIIDGAEKTAGNVLKTGENIITHTEDKVGSIISTPLMLIAGGLGLFLVMNGKGITNVAGQAVQKI